MIINNVTNEKEGGSVMKLFELIALENKEFDSFLIPLTHESLYSFWPEIESSERILHHTGKLLIDNLLADHRTKEAARYLKEYAGLPAHKPFMVPVYEAAIALARNGYNKMQRHYSFEKFATIVADTLTCR